MKEAVIFEERQLLLFFFIILAKTGCEGYYI